MNESGMYFKGETKIGFIETRTKKRIKGKKDKKTYINFYKHISGNGNGKKKNFSVFMAT